MLYTYPDYYERFICVADKCEDTCCAGWQIVIDEKSMDKYRKLNSEDGRIDWNEAVFKQCEDKRCAFLNEKNLCDMYIEWGKYSLCDTCRRYPRHIEEFENVREYTLSISCPEVAKIILSNKNKVTFIEKEDDVEEVDEEFDVLLFSMLEDVRQVMYKLLQNRDLTISQRVSLIIGMADECQELIDADSIFEINYVIDEYENNVDECLKNCYDDIVYDDEASLDRFRRLYELEVLNDLWADMTDEAAQLVYGEGEKNYNWLHKNFEKWLDENMNEHSIIWEQILVYFISTYFCGAVYDGNVYGKVEMAVTSLVCIYEMLLARWEKNDRQLSFDDIVFVTYMYSRELEHSDINLETMEE